MFCTSLLLNPSPMPQKDSNMVVDFGPFLGSHPLLLLLLLATSSACTAPAHWQYNFLLLRCSRRRRKLAQLSLAATAPQAAAASPVCRGTAATTVCLRQLSACLPTFFYVPTYYQIACYTSRVSEFLVTVWPEPI